MIILCEIRLKRRGSGATSGTTVVKATMSLPTLPVQSKNLLAGTWNGSFSDALSLCLFALLSVRWFCAGGCCNSGRKEPAEGKALDGLVAQSIVVHSYVGARAGTVNEDSMRLW